MIELPIISDPAMLDSRASGEFDLVTIRQRLADAGPRQLWRSLEEAAATPEFEKYLQREFPSQLAVWEDPIGRRRFLTLMAASLALAGVTGCTRSPTEKIVPYTRDSEGQVPGRSQFFATALTRGGYGYGVLVESHQGRPTKIEGNPEHPVTRGATDAFLQASILSLYDPDRSQTILHRGVITTWEKFVKSMSAEMERLRQQQGRGLRILTPTVTSPTLEGQLNTLLKKYPQARWHSFEPVSQDHARAGATLVFEQEVDSLFHFDRARIILALDCDFLCDLPGSLKYARDFVDGRRITATSQTMNRLYVAEGAPSITGAMADHRIPLRPSRIEALARQLLRLIQSEENPGTQQSVLDVPDLWLRAVVQDLSRNRGSSIVITGTGQPPIVHALVHAINEALGNVGKTVTYVAPVVARPPRDRNSLDDLVSDMSQGHVSALMILGGNPVYNAPGELRFSEALVNVPVRVHLSDFNDETSFLCDWLIPAAHDLESWSDTRAFDGTATILQPLIAPLYEGKTGHELVAVLMGDALKSPYELVRQHWQAKFDKNDFERLWRRAVHSGVVPETQSPPVAVELKWTHESDFPKPASTEQNRQMIEIEFHPDSTIWDGQFANNGWLQELPKPLTKICWDNVAYVSPDTAAQMGFKNGTLIDVTINEHAIPAPVWVMPGQPDNCVSLSFGYGRTRSGRVGTNIGYNAYSILPSKSAWFAVGTVRKTGDLHPIATTQHHHNMEGRDIVRVVTFDQLLDQVQRASDPAPNSPPALPTLYPAVKYEGNSWGMVIDQTACIGCNACVVACQAENNIPVVGKEQVAVGREMHWLRIDRYFHGEPAHPEIYFQPMMCVHCENAPCEVVCPVGATVHDSEGTNTMVYNRCVGTRYCSNNCPYKVRRFNYLQFSDETTPSLKLLRNPEVTVRSRGVMEKCSYCIQRISAARITSKLDHQAMIHEGDVVTACQQACPTQAIVFGNLNDPESRVRTLKASPRNYGVLAELNTVPRTTYLSRVVNPHPDLPIPGAAGPG